MQRIKLILADPDSFYVDRVSDYINSSCASRVKLVTFTRQILLEHYLHANLEEVDVLLIAPGFYDSDSVIYRNVKLKIFLTDDKPETIPEGVNCVYKYQTGDSLIKQIFNLYGNTDNARTNISGEKSTQIITVFSPAGGVGKTTLTLGLGNAYAKMGQEVFVLNLETLSSMACTLKPSHNDGFTKVLLTLTENPELIPGRVEMYSNRHLDTGVFYLDPPDCFLELAELTSKDMSLFLDKLKRDCRYDVILVDLDSVADRRGMAIFEHSDKIILVGTPDEICIYKVSRFIEHLRKIDANAEQGVFEKIVHVLNKCNHDQVFEFFGIKEFYKIPEVGGIWVKDAEEGCKYDPDNNLSGNIADLIKNLETK